MKIISSREVYRSTVFRVTEDHASDSSGFEIKRAIVRHVDSNGRMLLVRQYRLPAQKEMWELPAGRLDEGESPLEAAKRELIEETGYRAGTWKELISFYPSPGYVEEKMTIFLATDLAEGKAEPMDDERIESRWFAPQDLDEMIRSGKMDDAKTLIGFMAWQRYL